MKNIMFGVAALTMGLMAAVAQEATRTEVPTALPTTAPELSSWTIAFAYTDKKDDSARQAQYQTAVAKLAIDDPLLAAAISKGRGGGFVPRVKEVSVVKTNDVEQQIVTYLGGQSEESWKSPTARAARNPISGKIEYRSPGAAALDFPELKWVTDKHFIQTRKVQGVDCLVFRGRVARMQIENPVLIELTGSAIIPDTEAEVVVDAKTHLPVSVQTDETKRTYIFHEPPTATLAMPEEFASAIRDAQAKLRARLAPHSAP